MNARARLRALANVCDRVIEWADYRSDRTWRIIGRFVPNLLAERINAWIDRRTSNRRTLY